MSDDLGRVSLPPLWLFLMSRFTASDPGSLYWYPDYLLWKWLGLCRIGHAKIVRADKDCDMFWGAELDLLHFKRHPEQWSEAELTEKPSDET